MLLVGIDGRRTEWEDRGSMVVAFVVVDISHRHLYQQFTPAKLQQIHIKAFITFAVSETEGAASINIKRWEKSSTPCAHLEEDESWLPVRTSISVTSFINIGVLGGVRAIDSRINKL